MTCLFPNPGVYLEVGWWWNACPYRGPPVCQPVPAGEGSPACLVPPCCLCYLGVVGEPSQQQACHGGRRTCSQAGRRPIYLPLPPYYHHAQPACHLAMPLLPRFYPGTDSCSFPNHAQLHPCHLLPAGVPGTPALPGGWNMPFPKFPAWAAGGCRQDRVGGGRTGGWWHCASEQAGQVVGGKSRHPYLQGRRQALPMQYYPAYIPPVDIIIIPFYETILYLGIGRALTWVPAIGDILTLTCWKAGDRQWSDSPACWRYQVGILDFGRASFYYSPSLGRQGELENGEHFRSYFWKLGGGEGGGW